MGEGILFGHRYFDEVIRTFTGVEIVLSVTSLFLIFKEKQMGYVLLIVSVLCTYIIQFGHRMLWWPCEYCILWICSIMYVQTSFHFPFLKLELSVPRILSGFRMTVVAQWWSPDASESMMHGLHTVPVKQVCGSDRNVGPTGIEPATYGSLQLQTYIIPESV